MRQCFECGELSRPAARCEHCGTALRGAALPAKLALVGLTLLSGVSCTTALYGIVRTDVDDDKDGWGFWYGDCDDRNPAVHPDANEVAGDGIDSDCDGADDPAGDTGE